MPFVQPLLSYLPLLSSILSSQVFPALPPCRPDIKMKSRIFVIPTQIMEGSGEMLFDHIVRCLAIFMNKEGLLGEVTQDYGRWRLFLEAISSYSI